MLVCVTLISLKIFGQSIFAVSVSSTQSLFGGQTIYFHVRYVRIYTMIYKFIACHQNIVHYAMSDIVDGYNDIDEYMTCHFL